jgi:hypothetical protein
MSSAPRERMNAGLKRVLVPCLRARGFTGSLPHFRRRRPTRIDLLTVQFFSGGGSFVVEVASCAPTGHRLSWKHVEPTKATAHQVHRPRPRLGGPDFPAGDHWCHFAPRFYVQPDYDQEMPSPTTSLSPSRWLRWSRRGRVVLEPARHDRTRRPTEHPRPHQWARRGARGMA